MNTIFRKQCLPRHSFGCWICSTWQLFGKTVVFIKKSKHWTHNSWGMNIEGRKRVTTVPEQCSIRASRRAFNYAQGKTDTETYFVVTVGFTTKVDHQTTSKIWDEYKHYTSWSIVEEENQGNLTPHWVLTSLKGSMKRSLLPSAIFLIFSTNRPWKSEDHLCTLFFIELSKERLEKSERTPPVSWRPWALAYGCDRPYNFSCL